MLGVVEHGFGNLLTTLNPSSYEATKVWLLMQMLPTAVLSDTHKYYVSFCLCPLKLKHEETTKWKEVTPKGGRVFCVHGIALPMLDWLSTVLLG